MTEAAVSDNGQCLPAEWYAKPEAFSRERRRIFAETWLLFGRGDQLVRPGDYLAMSIAGWPVVAMADETGNAHAFRNVCRHQGLPVFDSGAGRCEMVRCRYHGWTYDFTGRFIGAPAASAPPSPEDPMHHLERVALVKWQDLLLVYLGRGAAPPMEAVTGAGLHLDGLRFHREQAVDIMANWKVVMERYLTSAPPAGATREWCWPNLIFERSPLGLALIQLVPRAFQRTLAVHHLYGGIDESEAQLAAQANAAACTAGTLKTEAEADYAKLASGVPIDRAPLPMLGAFRARVRSLHGVSTTGV